MNRIVKILMIVLGCFVALATTAQVTPPDYYPDSKRNYVRGLAVWETLHAPAGGNAALGNKGWIRQGALYYDSTGADSGLYVKGALYNWKKLAYSADVDLKLNITDTANKWVNSITKNATGDSLVFFIGSTRYALKDSSGSSGVLNNANAGAAYRWLNPATQEIKTLLPGFGVKVDSTSDELMVSVNSEEIIGEIYNATSWANLDTFIDNSSGAAIASTKINFTGGSNTYVKTLGYKEINGLEKYVIAAKVSVNDKTDTSYGFGIGSESINASSSYATQYLVQFDQSTGANSGKLIFRAGTGNYTSATVTSATGITFNAGDQLKIIVERDREVVTASIRNLTTGAATDTASVTYAYPYNSGPPYPADAGKLAIFNIGGEFTIDSLSIVLTEIKYPSFIVIGDSKHAGSNVSDRNARFPTKMNNAIGSTVVTTGQGDKTAEALQILPQILKYVKPKTALIGAFSNDIRVGTSSATWQANYDSIEKSLRNAGINVYHLLPFYESMSQAAWTTFIKSTYAADSIIDTYTPTLECSGCVTSLHPNNAGHLAIFKAIEKKNLPGATNAGQEVDILRNEFNRPQKWTSYINGKWQTDDSLVGNALRTVNGAQFFNGKLTINNTGYSSSPKFLSTDYLYFEAPSDIIVFRGGTGTGNSPVMQLEQPSSVQATRIGSIRFFNNSGGLANSPGYLYTTGFGNSQAGDLYVMAGGANNGGAYPTGALFGSYNLYLLAGGAVKLKQPPTGTSSDSILLWRASDSSVRKIDFASVSGGSGSPGGSNTQVQYNNSGSFGGITGATTDGTTMTLTSPVLTTSATTGSTSFDLLNTTATTINFGGAANTIQMGTSTVALKLGGSTSSSPSIVANGANVSFLLADASAYTNVIASGVIAGATTFNLANASATTVNAFGAATTLNIGASAATVLNFGGSTSAAEFRFLEPSGSGTNYIGFKAPAMAGNTTYTLPDSFPAGNGYSLVSTTSGVLSWSNVSGGGGSGITIGTTTITSGTNTRVLYNNSGVVGEYTISGTGSVAMTASPTFTGTLTAATISVSTAISANSSATMQWGSSSATANIYIPAGINAGNVNLTIQGQASVSRIRVGGGQSNTLTANQSYVGAVVPGTAITEAASGTHNIATTAAIMANTITNGSGTITDATTLYIEGAPTGTFTPANRATAMWVASGVAKFGGVINLMGYTVATLPTGQVGDYAYVTDASSPTYGAIVTGGGSVVTPVFFDGTNWTCR